MDDRYDVVIYEIETKVIDAIVGENMPLSERRINAVSRLETVLPRLNEHCDAAIVPAGKYAVGMTLDMADVVEAERQQ